MKDARSEFERDERKRIEQAVPGSPQIMARLHDLGIEDIEVPRIMLKDIESIPDDDIFSDPGSDALDDRLKWLNQIARFQRRAQRGDISQLSNKIESLVACQVIFDDAWTDLPRASAIMSRTERLLESNVTNYSKKRELARLLGMNFEKFASLLPDGGEKMRAELILNYPIGILPSLDVAKLSPDIVEKFDLNDALEVSNMRLLSAPYEEDGILRGRVVTRECNVCASAEEYFDKASMDTGSRISLTANGEEFGFMKKYGEWSFLVTKSVVKDGRPMLLKGGIYQFHGERFDENVTSVDVEDGGHEVGVLPLRMWEDDDVFVSKDPEVYKRVTMDGIIHNLESEK